MSDTGNTTTRVSRVVIHGSINDVWREITKTGEIQKCMFNMVLHTTGLRPGAAIQMRTHNNRYVGIVGEVLEIDAPNLYSHTFRFTQYDDAECTVTYRLKEVEGGVEFTLTAAGVPVGTKTEKQMTSGGDMIVNTLKNVVEAGRPALGIRLLYLLFDLMEPFSPKSTRVEHWPLPTAPSAAAGHD